MLHPKGLERFSGSLGFLAHACVCGKNSMHMRSMGTSVVKRCPLLSTKWTVVFGTLICECERRASTSGVSDECPETAS